jgi:ligand-binding SRPBCC domain-containing protein
MRTYILEREQVIPRPRTETFAFFCDAFNLERLTPPFLNFRIVTPRPIRMEEGALIDYKLSLYGLPLAWRSRIESWSPDERFVDTQIRGPYATWRHTHTFEAIAPGRTLMRDNVQYQLPFGPFGELAHAVFVERSLNEIFDYRANVIAELLLPKEQPEL